MKRFILIFLIFLSVFILFSQEGEDNLLPSDSHESEFAPEEMELVIPTILLEVEEEKLALIEAPLPGDEERTLSDLVLSLPDAPELEVSPLEVNAPTFPVISSIMTGIDPVEMEGEEEQKYFFSTGLIGGGTGSRILGDITLYKLGPSPRFQLQFLHEGIAGFGGHKAGEGFSVNREKLSGNLVIESDGFLMKTDIEYNEVGRGLQGETGFSSLTIRDYFVNSSFSYYLSDFLGVKGAFYICPADQWLSGTDPPRFEGMTVSPEGTVFLENDRGNLEFTTGYRFESAGQEDGEKSDIHSITGKLTASTELKSGIDIEGQAGVFWEPGNLPDYPVTLKVQGEPGGIFVYSVLERIVKPASIRDLWVKYPWIKPLTDTAGALDLTPVTGWSGLVHSRWSPLSFLTLDGEVEYRYLNNGFIPLSTDAGGLSPIKREEVNGLFTGASFSLDLPGSIVFKAGWKGQFYVEADPYLPLHRVSGELSWLPGGDIFGATLNGDLNIFGDDNPVFTSQLIPEIGFTGFLGITPGIRLIVEGEDILSPLLDSGRLVWDNYKDTGFALTLKLGISL